MTDQLYLQVEHFEEQDSFVEKFLMISQDGQYTGCICGGPQRIIIGVKIIHHIYKLHLECLQMSKTHIVCR